MFDLVATASLIAIGATTGRHRRGASLPPVTTIWHRSPILSLMAASLRCRHYKTTSLAQGNAPAYPAAAVAGRVAGRCRRGSAPRGCAAGARHRPLASTTVCRHLAPSPAHLTCPVWRHSFDAAMVKQRRCRRKKDVIRSSPAWLCSEMATTAARPAPPLTAPKFPRPLNYAIPYGGLV